MSTQAERLALSEAIHTICSEPLVTKWTVVAEVVTANGPKEMCIIDSDGLMAWDRIGMLAVANIKSQQRLSRGGQ